MQVDCDVVVVGAGYAGLIAARNLIEADKRVIVLEAGSRVGGRAYSAMYPDTNEVVDWGAEWVLPAHHHALMAEAKRYDVALEEGGEAGMPRWQIDGTVFHASVAEMLAANPAVAAILNRFEIAASKYIKDGIEPIQSLSDALAGETPHDAELIKTALFSLTGAHPDDLGLAMVLNEICYHGGSVLETVDPKHISRIECGTGEIAKRIEAKLPEGTIQFGCSVDAIADRSDGVVVSGDFGQVTCHKVILALPLNILKNIHFTPSMPPTIKDLIEEGHAGRTVKLWALVQGNTLPEECTLSGHPFRLTYAKPVAAARYLICAQALIDEVPETSEAALKAWFNGIYPDQTILEIAMHDWVSDPFALGSWHAGRPGQEVALRAMRETNGNIIFCGGDFSDNWSGWIEGAILSGAKAAKTATLTFP